MPDQTELDKIVDSLNLQIPKRPESDVLTPKTFSELKSYVQEQTNFWNTTVPDVAQKFAEIGRLINEAEASRNSDESRSKIVQASGLLARDPNIVDASTAAGQFLKRLAGRDRQSAVAAFMYLRRGPLDSDPYSNFRPLSTSSGIDGIIAAALFSHPELLSEKIAAEEAASSAQRSRATEVSNNLKAEFETIRRQVSEWQESSVRKAEDLLKEERGEFEKASEAWQGDHDNKLKALDELSTNWQQQFTDLSAAYREKLRLEDAAKYWGELERKYVVQGRIWIAATAAVVLALARWVSVLVYQPPDMFKEDKFTLSGIKGAILVAAGVAGFLYLINLVVKVATSSYHLARDARERLQLTHVFLALIKA